MNAEIGTKPGEGSDSELDFDNNPLSRTAAFRFCGFSPPRLMDFRIGANESPGQYRGFEALT